MVVESPFGEKWEAASVEAREQRSGSCRTDLEMSIP